MGCDFSDWILGLESRGETGGLVVSIMAGQPTPPNVPPPEIRV